MKPPEPDPVFVVQPRRWRELLALLLRPFANLDVDAELDDMERRIAGLEEELRKLKAAPSPESPVPQPFEQRRPRRARAH